jgi:flagellin-specific chaperone FliS
MCRRLLLASLRDDRPGFDEVARLLNELRGAWATIAAAPAPAEAPADLTAV